MRPIWSKKSAGTQMPTSTARPGPARATAASAPRAVWSVRVESSAAPTRSEKSAPWGTMSFSASIWSASRQPPARAS